MIDNRLVTHMVQSAILNTGRPVGIGDVPKENPERPYVVIDSIQGGTPEGSYQDEHDMRDLLWSVQFVGGDWDECAGMQAAAQNAWLTYGRQVTKCVGLWIDQPGAIVRVDDQTYNATDTWRMKVQA
jgi:hypothetical protein